MRNAAHFDDPRSIKHFVGRALKKFLYLPFERSNRNDPLIFHLKYFNRHTV